MAVHFLSPETIERRLETVPPTIPERRRELEVLFREAGCTAPHLSEQGFAHGKDANVVCVLPGKEPSEIIAGGHLDLVNEGTGAVDDWSGASLLPSLFESLKNAPRLHTFVFIAFDGEETGLRGSRNYVASLKPADRASVRAMVNLECLGMALPKVWASRADPSLLKAYWRIAAGLNLPREGVNVDGAGDDDSHPFLDKGIPVITIHSVTPENLRVLHSPRDNLKAIHPEEYYQSYRLAAAYLTYLDTALP